MTVVFTPSAAHLDIDGRELTVHPNDQTRQFPDDEVYVQLEGLESGDAVTLIHSGQPHPNRGLAYLYGALDLLRHHECTVSLVFTYVPYSRQDRAFYEGTLNYARSILRVVTEYYGVDEMYAIDPHFSHRDWVQEFPLEWVQAFPEIQSHVELDEYLVIGPDLGAVERFGVPSYEKHRKSATDVELIGDLDVAGRAVLVFDDLISTGGTMIEAYTRLCDQGASTVHAAAVHGVIDDGVRRVQKTYDQLYLTNSVQSEAATVPVEPLIERILDDSAR